METGVSQNIPHSRHAKYYHSRVRGLVPGFQRYYFVWHGTDSSQANSDVGANSRQRDNNENQSTFYCLFTANHFLAGGCGLKFTRSVGGEDASRFSIVDAGLTVAYERLYVRAGAEIPSGEELYIPIIYPINKKVTKPILSPTRSIKISISRPSE